MDNILEIHNLYKSYHGVPALRGVDLTLLRGRVVGLLGPNGSGKTTLIKLLMGLLTPTSGSLLIDGIPVGAETKSHVSYLPDCDFLPQDKSVNALLTMYGDFFADFRRDRAEEMLANLHIDPTRKTKTLSKGNREKVALILTMSREADLYLLDEPIAGVDPATRDYILRTIISNYSEHSTVLISTHLITDVEPVLDDVIFLCEGEIRLCKPADTVREETGKSVDEVFREVFRC